MATLLLADDSPTTQKVVRLTFADEGIEVMTVEDGDTALELFNRHKPDIVLADVNIPGLNGYEVCESIRKLDGARPTPVVLLVGSFEPFDPTEAHRVGANDYLTKPFSSIRRLVATVTGLLDVPVTKDEGSSPLHEAARATAANVEPDIVSTSDIDHLYTKSLPETVEIPQPPAEKSGLGEPAMDDELIETSYAAPTPTAEAEKVEELHTAAERSPDQPQESAAYSEAQGQHAATEMAETQQPPEPFHPIIDGGDAVPEHQAAAEQPVLEQPAVENFPFEELSDETYFEPAPEIPEERTDIADVSVPAEQSDTHEAPTPWDSIVGPAERGFRFDEANLLELPVSADRADQQPTNFRPDQPGELPMDKQFSDELIEQIARATASQISEQLVREIAERVVPRVIEEMMARRSAEEVNR